MSCDDVYGIFHQKEIIIPNRSTQGLFTWTAPVKDYYPEKRISGKIWKRKFSIKNLIQNLQWIHKDFQFSIFSLSHLLLLLFELIVTKFLQRSTLIHRPDYRTQKINLSEERNENEMNLIVLLKGELTQGKKHLMARLVWDFLIISF